MPSPTLNQISTLPFENNLILNGLSKEDKSSMVFDFSLGYNVVDLIVSKVSSSRQIVGRDGVFQKPIMGVSVVQSTVASTVVNGSLLRINFVDNSYDKFRKSEVVSDNTANDTYGRVVNSGAGFIEVEYTPGITAWDTATQFVAGSTCTAMWNAQQNRGSGAMASLYEFPEYVSNQTSIMRENVELYRRDASQTWVEFQGDYWYSAQDMIMMQRIARASEYRALFSRYGTQASSDGTVNYSMGAKAAIKDPTRGGVYSALANLPTQGDVEGFFNQIADRQNVQDVEINMMVGRGLLNRIQGFTSDYIKYAGKNNTFGGDTVRGLDVRQYDINGVHVNLIPAPILNDTDRFSGRSSIAGAGSFTRMQYTGIVLDTQPYEAVGGGSLPAMEKVYFGDEEMVYYYVPGIIGSNLKGGSNSMLRTGDFNLAVNNNDSVTTGFYSDCAYDFMARRMGWLELAY
jgi:hypothetical protein